MRCIAALCVLVRLRVAAVMRVREPRVCRVRAQASAQGGGARARAAGWPIHGSSRSTAESFAHEYHSSGAGGWGGGSRITHVTDA